MALRPTEQVVCILLSCIVILLAGPTISEELRDIWYHDHGVAQVGQPQAGAGPSASSGKPTDPVSAKERLPMADNNTMTRKRKIIGTDLSEDQDISPVEQQCNFRGQSLRIAVSPQPPFVNCLQDVYGDWLCNGSNIELIQVLERRLNFRANWVVLANSNHEDDIKSRPSKPQLGRTLSSERMASGNRPTGPYVPQISGVFNLVATGRVLMSANGVMRTLDRSSHNLIVSEPFDSFKLHFLLSKSVRDHDHLFIKPFNAQSWLAILASAALIVPIFYLINSTSFHYSIQDDRPLRDLSLWQCLRWRLKAAFGMGALASSRRRSSSSSSSLDQELSRVFQIETSLDKSPSAIGLAIARPLHIPGVSERRRRVAMRRWANERRRALKLGRRNRNSGFFKVAYIIWYVVASLANQGGETEDLPRADSTRILVAFWWLYLIVICAIHSGILTAILTFPKQIDFIQTLDDYLNLDSSDRDSLRLSVDKNSELAHLLVNFENLHKSPLQLLRNQSVPVTFVNFQRHRQRILDDVQQGRSAFMEEKSTIAQIISQEYYDSRQSTCLYKFSRYPIDVIPMSLILSKNMSAICITTINRTLKRILKTGLAQKWRRNYESPGNDCLNTVVINAGDVDKIELKHVMLALWLLCLGILIGLLFLIAEIVWLFMIEDEDEDDDEDDNDDDLTVSSLASSNFSSSSSCSLDSASYDSSDNIRLGFRRAIMPIDQQLESIRSLKAKKMPVRTVWRKIRRHHKRNLGPVPKITFSMGGPDEQEDEKSRRNSSASRSVVLMVVDEREGFKEVKEIRARHLQERRARRMARDADRRAKRIQKTFDLLKRLHGGKVYSSRLKNRVRRMSHSVMSQLSRGLQQGSDLELENTEAIMRRRAHLTLRVAPM